MVSKTTAKEHQLRAIIINIHSYLKMLQMFEYITWQKNLHNLYINRIIILLVTAFSHKACNFIAKFDKKTLLANITMHNQTYVDLNNFFFQKDNEVTSATIGYKHEDCLLPFSCVWHRIVTVTLYKQSQTHTYRIR